MDNGLLLFVKKDGGRYAGVLILIVMDNGLLQYILHGWYRGVTS